MSDEHAQSVMHHLFVDGLVSGEFRSLPSDLLPSAQAADSTSTMARLPPSMPRQHHVIGAATQTVPFHPPPSFAPTADIDPFTASSFLPLFPAAPSALPLPLPTPPFAHFRPTSDSSVSTLDPTRPYVPSPDMTAALSAQVLSLLSSPEHGSLTLDQKIATLQRVLADAEADHARDMHVQQVVLHHMSSQAEADRRMRELQADLERTQQQQELVAQALRAQQQVMEQQEQQLRQRHQLLQQQHQQQRELQHLHTHVVSDATAASSVAAEMPPPPPHDESEEQQQTKKAKTSDRDALAEEAQLAGASRVRHRLSTSDADAAVVSGSDDLGPARRRDSIDSAGSTSTFNSARSSNALSLSGPSDLSSFSSSPPSATRAVTEWSSSSSCASSSSSSCGSSRSLSSDGLSKIFFRNFLEMSAPEVYKAEFEAGAVSQAAIQQHGNWMASHLNPDDAAVLLEAFANLSVSAGKDEVIVGENAQTVPPPKEDGASTSARPSDVVGGPRKIMPISRVPIEAMMTSPQEAITDEMDGAARWRITMIMPQSNDGSKKRKSVSVSPGDLYDPSDFLPSSPTPLSSGPDGASVAPSTVHTIVQVNHAWQNLLGYTQDYMVALSSAERPLKFHRRDFVPAAHRILIYCMMNKVPVYRQYVVIVDKFGVEHYCIEYWQSTYDPHGVFLGGINTLIPLPRTQPLPPFDEDVEIDEATILYGYRRVPPEEEIVPWKQLLKQGVL